MATEDESLRMPETVTPFSAVITLRRFARVHADRLNREERNLLESEIAQLEKCHFAKGDVVANQDAGALLKHWHRRLVSKA